MKINNNKDFDLEDHLDLVQTLLQKSSIIRKEFNSKHNKFENKYIEKKNKISKLEKKISELEN